MVMENIEPISLRSVFQNEVDTEATTIGSTVTVILAEPTALMLPANAVTCTVFVVVLLRWTLQ